LFATWQLKKIQGGDDSYKGFLGKQKWAPKLPNFKEIFFLETTIFIRE
jgi:hypothetical protein